MLTLERKGLECPYCGSRETIEGYVECFDSPVYWLPNDAPKISAFSLEKQIEQSKGIMLKSKNMPGAPSYGPRAFVVPKYYSYYCPECKVIITDVLKTEPHRRGAVSKERQE